MMASTSILPLHNIPKPALIEILLLLDIKSILNLQQCSKELSKILKSFLENNLWKKFCLRDFHFFLNHPPAASENVEEILKQNGEILGFDTQEQSVKIHDDYGKRLKGEKYKKKAETDSQNKNIEWKKFYQESLLSNKFGGLYIGFYGAHGNEKLQVYQRGHYLVAVKITGDDNVPAGKISWKIKFDSKFIHGSGKIHLADSGFKNSRWGLCRALRVDSSIYISWFYKINILQQNSLENVFICLTFENRPISLFGPNDTLKNHSDMIKV